MMTLMENYLLQPNSLNTVISETSRKPGSYILVKCYYCCDETLFILPNWAEHPEIVCLFFLAAFCLFH